MNKINIIINNEVKCQFMGLDKLHIKKLHEDYSLYAPGYQFNAKYKLGIWDGTISFFTKHGHTFVYLIPEIVVKLKKWGYAEIDYTDNRTLDFKEVDTPITDDYFSHVIHQKTGKPYKLTDHQLSAANTMLSAGSGIALAGTGFGKAQPLYCKILTPSGWTTMGDIQVGDYVVTPKNTMAQVKGVFDQGITDVYKITLDDGSCTYGHPDHLWKIYTKSWVTKEVAPFSVRSTMDIVESLGKEKMYIPSIPVPINYQKYNYYISPYLAGALMPHVGVDHKGLYINHMRINHSAGYIRSGSLNKHFVHVCESHNIQIKVVSRVGSQQRGYLVGTDEKSQFVVDALKDFHMNKKPIPDQYIFCDINDRYDFIRGLCDMSGILSTEGSMTIQISNLWIRDQIKDMILLLGGCTMGKGSNTIRFTHLHVANFITKKAYKKSFMLYKQSFGRTDYRLKNRLIKSVEYIGKDQTKCIYIDDPDHLYITDNCIITHNTILNAVMVDSYQKLGCKTITIVPATSLIKQTLDQFLALGLDAHHYSSKNPSLEHDHIITTWQTLQHNPNLIKMFQMVVVDECLSGSTLITMADNTLKRLDEVVENDLVLSYNQQDNQYEVDVVHNVHANMLISSNEKMYKLEFDDGTVLEITGNHPILTVDGYVRADELGDQEVIQMP